jgi:hypothetical protein
MIRNDMRMAHFHFENCQYVFYCDLAAGPVGPDFQFKIGDLGKVDSSKNGNSYYMSTFRERKSNNLSYL